MFYYFHKDDMDQCKLICGDVGGNVRVLQFSAKLRGPFKGEAGQPMKKLRYVDLQMRVIYNLLLGWILKYPN